MLHALLNDESGFIVSLELVLVASIAVLSLVVGLNEVAVAINTELNDISNAVGALDQSYFVSGFSGFDGCKFKSQYAHGVGSRWTDQHDDCDKNLSCDIVTRPPQHDTCG